MSQLGTLHGEVWVFGGPYSNYQALKAFRCKVEKAGVPASHVIGTGDLVAYCGQPQECIDLVREWGVPVLMGNCEESLANDAEDCGCGFVEGSACSLLSVSWFNFSRNALDSGAIQWMAGLPRTLNFEFAGKQFLCLHGSLNRINEFVFASTDSDLKLKQLDDTGVDCIIGGHCGLPFGQVLEGKAWLNAGTIGIPANDGGQYVWYMRLKESSGTVSVSWHRLNYDVSAAQAVMHAKGLPPDYRESLATGLWPSMDCLPETERAQQGQTISPETLSF